MRRQASKEYRLGLRGDRGVKELNNQGSGMGLGGIGFEGVKQNRRNRKQFHLNRHDSQN